VLNFWCFLCCLHFHGVSLSHEAVFFFFGFFSVQESEEKEKEKKNKKTDSCSGMIKGSAVKF